MEEPRRVWLWALLVAVALSALYLLGSVGVPLAEPDEARYGEVAREMLVRHDWVTPHLNFQAYFHKPPLLFWLSAASFSRFGVSEFAGRLPVVLTGLLTLAMTGLLARRMYGAGEAVVAVAIAGFAPLFAFLAVILSPNMPLACFLTLALGAVWLAADSSGRAWWRVAYVSVALAVLAKGPVALVLIAVPAGLFLFARGGLRACWNAIDAVGVALASLVALPWFVLVSWRNPGFLHFFIVEQHVSRYLWNKEHTLAWWEFLALLPVGMLPWTLLPLLDVRATRASADPRSWTAASRYLALWVVVVMGFFALSSSKLGTYVLPAIPPAAILLARFVCLTLRAGRHAFLSRAAPLLMIGGLVASLCGALLPFFIHHWRMPLIAPYLWAGGLALASGGWLVHRAVAAQRPWAALAAFACGCAALVSVAIAGRGLANESRTLGLAARSLASPGARLATYQAELHGLNFYTGQPYAVVTDQATVSPYGGPADPALRWQGNDALRRAWAGPDRVVMAIGPRALEHLAPSLDPAPIAVVRTPKTLLVTNRPLPLAR